MLAWLTLPFYDIFAVFDLSPLTLCINLIVLKSLLNSVQQTKFLHDICVCMFPAIICCSFSLRAGVQPTLDPSAETI